MKKWFLTLSCLVVVIFSPGASWIAIQSQTPSPAKATLVSSTIERSVVRITLDGYNTGEVLTPRGAAYTVSSGKMTPMLATGAPDLPKMAVSLIIPDRAGMSVRVISSSYRDFENLDIAPSKGELSRTVDPSRVPYQYGKAYQVNAFFPGMLTDTREPYIMRDVRGQTLLVYPFQYNPVTKILRVYYDLTVEMFKSSETGFNPLIRKDPVVKVNKEFESIYEHRFLNKGVLTYTPLPDYGNMLVICYGPFMSAMQPFITWKNESGIPTEMVDVAAAGSTSTDIKNYIVNYYNTKGLTFVLLVGDAPQIPTNTDASLGGPSDNAYGYIVGNDHYADAFIGRFSAETVDQVQTMVQRSVEYEKTPKFLTNDWYTTVLGIGSDQGPGDDGEYDYQHIRNLQAQCLGYTYTMNPELFDGTQGGNDAPGNPGPGDVSPVVNDGTGLILYCGHGSETSWGTTGFSNTNVNQLTNAGKLPFIWSVACVNGAFMNTTCFAEAWLRATKNGQPTGAVAFLGSTINQSWNSPMDGEDEMVAILVESYPDNIKRTYGGLSINGCMKMIDSYGIDGQNMADTWTIFGDPSLMVRTANPMMMSVTHTPNLYVGQTSLTVNCNIDGARATAALHDTILATGLIANHSIVLTFPPLMVPLDTVVLTVTNYNNYPYQDEIPVYTANSPYVVYIDNHVNDTTGNNNDLADYGEDILLSLSLKNVGALPASSVNTIIRSSDPYVSFSDTTELYGDFQAGETKSVYNGFGFHVSNLVSDGHTIPFEVIAEDSSQVWTSGFSIQAHAPVLSAGNCIVVDSTGNNNGRLDPGETAFLKVYINNTGSSDASNVTGKLISLDPHVTITPSSRTYGGLSAGDTKWQWFTAAVDTSALPGETASLLLEITADKEITAAGNISLPIGKIPILIVDLDNNTSSGPLMQTAITCLGVTSVYRTQAIPDTLDKYSAIFVCLGVYPDNHQLTNDEGTKLASYLNGGGRLYMEGADAWAYDPQTPVYPMFNITGEADGSGDLATVQGITGTFTDGMSFTYSGDNQYIDHIAPANQAFTILKNQLPEYNTTVANDAGTYRTIGSSSEFGGLADGDFPSTKQNLMEQYLTFFGIPMPVLAANFAGFPTDVIPGGTCSFFDYSTGSISARHWSFPGGTPDTSSEKNPVITYYAPGVYDVRLVVENSTGKDSLIRAGYIKVDYPAGISYSGGSSIVVSPNPNNGIFSISGNSITGNTAEVQIMTSNGMRVFSNITAVRDHAFIIKADLTACPSGIYFIEIKGNGEKTIRRIVIQH